MSRRRPTYYFAQGVLRIVIRSLFAVEVRGRERIPRDRQLIVASNHQSNFDPPLVGSWLPVELYIVAKRQLFENAFLGAVIRYFNAVPIDREGSDRRAMARLSQLLKAGHNLLVFPEGTRSRDGKLGKARAGVGLLAAGCNCDILPVLVRGSRQKPRFLLKRPRLLLEYGHPVPAEEIKAILEETATEGGRAAAYQRVADRVLAEIQMMMNKDPQ